jgi:hypothetical protein
LKRQHCRKTDQTPGIAAKRQGIAAKRLNARALPQND